MDHRLDGYAVHKTRPYRGLLRFFFGLLASRQPIGGGNLLDGGPMAMRSTLSKLLAQAKTVALARHEKLTACLSVALIPPAVQ